MTAAAKRVTSETEEWRAHLSKFFFFPTAKNTHNVPRPGGKYLYITSSSHGESCLPLFMTALGQFEGVLEPLEEGLEIAEAHVCAQFPEKVLMHVVGRCGGA